MHPEVEGVIRERAREYLAREVIEKGPYTQSAEAGVVSFNDIYFLGVCQASENVALDFILERDETMYPMGLMNEELQARILLESSKLMAELYDSNSDAMIIRWHNIQRKFASWVHSKQELG